MPLIEARKTSFGAEVKPILRNFKIALACSAGWWGGRVGCARRSCRASQHCVVVDCFRKGVLETRGEPAVQPAAQLNLSGFASGITIGRQISITGRAGRTRIG